MWAVFPPPSPPLISYWFLVSHQTSLLGCKKYVSFQPSGWKGGGGGGILKGKDKNKRWSQSTCDVRIGSQAQVTTVGGERSRYRSCSSSILFSHLTLVTGCEMNNFFTDAMNQSPWPSMWRSEKKISIGPMSSLPVMSFLSQGWKKQGSSEQNCTSRLP